MFVINLHCSLPTANQISSDHGSSFLDLAKQLVNKPSSQNMGTLETIRWQFASSKAPKPQKHLARLPMQLVPEGEDEFEVDLEDLCRR